MTRSRPQALDRRTVLRGAAAGLPLALGLPTLEGMLDDKGTAYAAGGAPILKRLGVWFFGAGGHREWTPAAEGALQLPMGLTPLERHRSKVLLVSGLEWESFGDFGTNRHFMGAASVLTGTPWKSGGPQGPSLDQVAARHLNQGRRASVELGVAESGAISFSGPASPNRPQTDPRKVYASLFGDAPSSRAMRALYLDAVRAEGVALRARLGVRDRLRLDGYLDGIRDIEKEIAALEAAGRAGTCATSAASAVGGITDDTLKQRSANLALVNRVMSKLLAAALACGHTQAFSYAFTAPNSSHGWSVQPALANNHHELGHQMHKDLPRSVDYLMQRLAETLDALAAIDEGGGTVLDNTALLVTTEVARNHESTNVPTLLVGGLVKGGQHLKAPRGSKTTRAGLTLLRACGAAAPSYGASWAMATEVLSGAL